MRVFLGLILLGILLIFSALAFAADPASQPVASSSLANVWTWLKANWPAIVTTAVFVIPALITALSKFPQTAGVVKVLQAILGFLSFLTHKDSEGTLKLPFTTTKPPEK